MTDDRRPTTVAAFTDALEASIARGRLEAEGIEAWVAHEHHVWANWLYSTALGGVKLQVRARDAARAKEILDALRAGAYALSPEDSGLSPEQAPAVAEAGDTARCPRCGSIDVTDERRSWRIAFLSFFLFSLPLPFRRDRYRCRRCGQRWQRRP